MRCLITGIGGFVGQYLAAWLLGRGEEVIGITRDEVQWHRDELRNGGPQVFVCDLLDASEVERAIGRSAPDQVYHLAADSSVGESFANPMAVFQNNVTSVVNLLEAVRGSGGNPRVLTVGSSEVYGRATGDKAIDERVELRPESPYAVSKAAADLVAYQYFAAHHLDIVRVRPFTHIGPGQSVRFVAASFARQIAEIERGLRPPVIEVGNLEARRDFTDVRDMVRAYELALAKGEPGSVYNIGRGSAVAVRTLLDVLLSQSRTAIDVRVEASRLRQVDAPLQVCDARKFRERTGWEPRIPLEQTLVDILEYARAQPGPIQN